MKHKDQAIAALLSSDAPCDRYACTARKRCAAELLACNALLIYVETGRAHDPRDYAPPTREVFDAIERDRAGHEHGMAYKTLKLPADRAAWAWAEFMEPGGVSELRVILPWPPRALSPNSRPPHWSVLARAKRGYRSACHYEALAAGWRKGAFAPTDRLHVGLVFVPPDRRRRDIDNLIAAMKSGLDGLADALGVDDSRWTLTCGVEDGIGGMVVVTICTLPGPHQALVEFEVAA